MKSGTVVVLFLLPSMFASLLPAAEAPAIWIDVPFVRQVNDGCGSAAISMVLEYWANRSEGMSPNSADPEKIQAALFSPELGGIPATRMMTYFQQSGYRTFSFPGNWSDLRHHLEQGRPLIVSLRDGGPHGPFHYVVVVGIDSERGYLFVNDPARQKMLRISREGFESEWSSARHWTLLVVPQAGH